MPESVPIDFDKLRVTVGALTDHLTQRDYEGACRWARRSRLVASELERAVLDYGRHLVALPVSGFQAVDVVAISNTRPQRWSVVVPLWTKEEGRSDLSLELTLEDSGAPTYSVEIEDLHVL